MTKKQTEALRQVLTRVPMALLRAEIERREATRRAKLTYIAAAFHISVKGITGPGSRHCYTEPRCAAAAILHRERRMKPPAIAEIFHATSDRVRKWIRKHDSLLESCPYYAARFRMALESEISTTEKS